jgi:maltose O-acetyltransferase
LDASAPISIGCETGIGMQVMIVTASHPTSKGTTDHHTTTPLPVTVGDQCWVGARCVILPGVAIGDHCIIGAGAVVVKDCEPFGLYAGVPARRVRDLLKDRDEGQSDVGA